MFVHSVRRVSDPAQTRANKRTLRDARILRLTDRQTDRLHDTKARRCADLVIVRWVWFFASS